MLDFESKFGQAALTTYYL